MRKSTFIAAIITLFYSFILGFICYQLGTMNPRETMAIQEVQTVQAEFPLPSPSPSIEPIYTIKEYNSKIGVYENDELIRIVDISITSLRENDAKLIKQGIIAHSKAEALEIIEDFNS